ncbi:kinase-like domain-containing protein [Mycena crocata]|nr:kinase-like domain-containing protein [Mycena crocata]
MAPIRTIPSIHGQESKVTTSEGRRNAKPPTGYKQKRILKGINVGRDFKPQYVGIHDGTGPYHYPVLPPVVDALGARPVDRRGPSLSLSDLECIRALGEGSYGQVLLVRTRGRAAENGATLFAVKAMKKKGLRQQDSTISTLVRRNCERTALVSMAWSPFVAGILETFYDDINVYMLLEYSPNGTFHNLVGPKKPLSPHKLLFYFANIVCALEHLEKSGIAHRDIKPGNILVGADGYLCLCDFGPALALPTDKHPAVASQWMGDGTAFYAAPEANSPIGQPANLRYGAAVDWWSAGAILFEMAAGRVPFGLSTKVAADPRSSVHCHGVWETIIATAGAIRWPRRVHVGRKLKSLVHDLLTVNANKRLGANGVEDVMAHPWLATVDWNKMRRKQYIAPALDTPAPAELAYNQKAVNPKHFPGLHFAE